MSSIWIQYGKVKQASKVSRYDRMFSRPINSENTLRQLMRKRVVADRQATPTPVDLSFGSFGIEGDRFFISPQTTDQQLFKRSKIERVCHFCGEMKIGESLWMIHENECPKIYALGILTIKQMIRDNDQSILALMQVYAAEVQTACDEMLIDPAA